MFIYFENKNQLLFYEDIYQRFHDPMCSAAHSILTGKYNCYAEDAVQDAFLSIAQHIDRVINIPPSKLKGVLIRIVKNKAIDIYRKESRVNKIALDELENNLADNLTSPLESAIISEDYGTIIYLIKRLDKKYKNILILKYIYRLSDLEISKLLGISPKNVNVRTYRAKKRLRIILQNEFGKKKLD